MKKLLSIIAVLVFALALTACGSKENDNTGKPGSGTENSSKTDNGSGTSGKKDESTSNNTSNDSNQNIQPGEWRIVNERVI